MLANVTRRAAVGGVIAVATMLSVLASAQENSQETGAATEVAMALEGAYWKIVSVDGVPSGEPLADRKAHMIFHADGRLNATVGCNMMRGTYELDGPALSFGPAAMTMTACPPPLDTVERALVAAMEATASYLLEGSRLSLLDAEGTVLASLEGAVES